MSCAGRQPDALFPAVRDAKGGPFVAGGGSRRVPCIAERGWRPVSFGGLASEPGGSQKGVFAMMLRGLVLVGWVFAARTASAQSAPAGQDFGALAATRTAIDVISDTGEQTRGRLLRFDANSLTMESHHREITLDRQHVAKVYQRGDSLKNGMLIGLAAGAGLGMFAAVATTGTCGGVFAAPRPCSAREKVAVAMAAGATFGAVGLGVGAGIDALFSERRLLYETPRHGDAASISIAPRFLGSGTGLLVTVTW